MNKLVRFILVGFLISFLSGSLTDTVESREIRLIKAGELFPDTPLRTPANREEREYLGLAEGEFFRLNEIKADLVLVEILSVYCTSCQRQTSPYNELYTLIEKDPKTRGRIKMIGIAAGNGDIEVRHFRDEYQVRFPIVPDPQFAMHSAIGGSRTPFAIYVRQDPADRAGLVAGTHLGLYKDYKRLFKELSTMMAMDLAVLKKESKHLEADIIRVEPVLKESELQDKVRDLFATFNGRITQFKRVSLKGGEEVFTAVISKGERSRRVFAKVISRPPTCDLCHDIHFIYVFDSSGEVLRFEPIQLTKYGNKPWDENDVAKMRGKVLGRYIFKPYVFDPEVDAVSSATITSSIIIHVIFEGEILLEELREKGLI
jgi:hypothetical protein